MPTAALSEEKQSATILRREGNDRFLTSAAISQLAFDQADTVVLTLANQPQVAALASPVAGLVGGPTLLTAPGHLSDSTRDEVTRLSATAVVLIAQDERISQDLLADLDDLDLDVDQIVAPGLGDLAVEVAATLDPTAMVYLTTTTSAETWQDSVRLAPWAAHDNAPIFPVTPGGLTPDTLEHLRESGTTRAVLGDGQSEAAAILSSQLRQLGIRMEFATWAEPPRSYERCGSGPIVAASDRSYPDASAAGPVIAELCGRLALVNPTDVEELTALVGQVAAGRDESDGAPDLVVLGGATALDPSAVGDIARVLGIPVPHVKGYRSLRSGGGDVLALVLAMGVLFVPSRRPRREPEDDDGEQERRDDQ